MIEIKNLTKIYDDRAVVDNISITIPRGSVFGFLGQNGSGKTTTMKIAVGIAKSDAGTVTIEGEPTSNVETHKKIGFMPEAPYFYDRLTGLEFLAFCRKLSGESSKDDENVYEKILKTVGIYNAKNHPIYTYSKGMKQRLGFAQTLVHNPEYIFLDEPLDGLDPIGRKEIKEIIKTLKSKGKTIFFNSHILYDTEELCDKIGIIHKGKILYDGDVKEFCGGRSLEEKFVSLVESQKEI